MESHKTQHEIFVLIDKFPPGTFLERGVAVPFTTPMLIGTRARPAGNAGIELIMPNPSGGRGTYLFNWADLSQFCQATLHDLALTERVEGLRMITPSSIRRAANEVGAEGLAGREVAEAAKRALQTQRQSSLLTNFSLLTGLMRQIEAPDAKLLPLEREDPARLEQRARRAIALFAPQLGLDGGQIANMLEELADMFLRVGVGATAASAHLPALVVELRRFRAGLAEWADQQGGPSADLAFQIAGQAEFTIRSALPLIARTQARGGNMVQLLRDYLAAPVKLAVELARPDWLLDGWELVCLRWRASLPAERETVIAELATMLPAIPAEAAEWGLNWEQDFDRSWLRKVRSGYDWRNGLMAFRAVERGEKMLELAYAAGAA